MTNDEKARAYDEALEKAREELKQDLHESGVWAIKRIFPELKESEDERIRKALICGLSEGLSEHNWQGFGGATIDECLSWLEKQKEQKSMEWSEEDENAFKYLHELISWGYAEKFMDAQTAHDIRAWVNERLRPDTFQNGNSRWKPSEEQIEALHTAIYLPEMGFYGGLKDKLRDLYEQLKRIKED